MTPLNPWQHLLHDSQEKDILPWKRKYTKFMVVWGVVSHVWLFIQAAKIIEIKDSSSISPYALGILLTSAIVWFVYGAIVLTPRDKIIMTSAIVSLMGGLFLLGTFIAYM